MTGQSVDVSDNSQPTIPADADRETFVDRVERRLTRLVEPDSDGEADVLNRAAGHLTLAPMAKRARPRLVYQFGRCFDVDHDDLVRIASAAELVHTASLLHDDVIDEGSERRGRPTVNTHWHNLVAVLSGNLALCLSLRELATLPRSLTNRAVDVVESMTRAMMQEADARWQSDVSVDQWRSIAVGKTGDLFGWCAAAPALTEGHADWGRRLFRAGRHLGAAFQRADDLRDLLSDREGKDRYADIENGVPSAVIAAATDREPEISQSLDALWSSDADRAEEADRGEMPTIETIAEQIIDSGALETVAVDLERDVQNAMREIGELKEHPAARDVSDWASSLCVAALDLIPDDNRTTDT